MTLNYEFEWPLSIHFARVYSNGRVHLSTRQVGPTCIVFGAELHCTKKKSLSVVRVQLTGCNSVNHIYPIEALFSIGPLKNCVRGLP